MLTPAELSETQQEIIDAMYGGNRLIIAAKGVGKTVCGFTAAQELIQAGICKRILIVAPLKPARMTWGEEHKKWSHLSAGALALGTAPVRRAAIESDSPIIIINFENLVWLLKSFDLAEIGIDGLLIDEASKLKGAGGAGVRALRGKLKYFNWRCAMTASPVSESGTEIYSQILIVDGGKALGRNQDAFKRRFFYPVDYMQYDWRFQPDGELRLAQALKNVVFTADDADYSKSLPELIDHTYHITLPEAARGAYRAMATDMLAELSGVEIEAANTAVMSGKLTQIAAGALYADDKSVHRLHNEKTNFLKTLIKPDTRALIAFWYKFEEAALREAFPDLPFLSDDPVGLQNKWNRREIPLLAVHPASTARGVNLQDGGSTLIMLGPVWSNDVYSQLVGRLRRRGQRHRVERHVVIAKDTIEEIMLERLAGKQISEKAILAHIKAAAEKKPGM